MKIGVTGASGVLGKIFTKKMVDENCQISCFKGDVRSKDDIKNWLSTEQLDTIIHFAALVPTNEVDKNRILAYETNVGGTINLLSELQELKKPVWLFYASTSHVYKSKDTPLAENDLIEPISLYGMTKYMGEKICNDVAKTPASNITLCCGRIFSFYHASQQKPFLYPTIIDRLNREDLNKPFLLHGANSKRDISNAEDIVETIIKIMKKKLAGTFNIGSGKSIAIKDFVQNLSAKKLDFLVPNDSSDILVANVSELEKALSK